MARPLLVGLVVLVLASGCLTSGPATPTPSSEAGASSPTDPKTPAGTDNTTSVILENQFERAYVLNVYLVAEPFDGATIEYLNGSTRSFPEASTVRELRRRANLGSALRVSIDGAAGVSLTAASGETIEGTLESDAEDPVLIYLLHERDDPANPVTHWMGAYTCVEGNDGFGPVHFTLFEDGSQQFDPECFYATPP